MSNLVKGVSIFVDGANLDTIKKYCAYDWVKGFTSNPTLMKKAGISNYFEFAQRAIEASKGKPISLEVLADTPKEIVEQAKRIAKWGPNVNVKIPVVNSSGEFNPSIFNELSRAQIHLNITAIFTLDQVLQVLPCIASSSRTYLSVFAGRIADTGRDPEIIMRDISRVTKNSTNIELIWASPREVFNIHQAARSGCHIITVPEEILVKRNLINKDLDEYSKETAKMFFEDAKLAGFNIP